MKFTIKDLRQNTPQWEQWRGEPGVVSASQAPVLMGVGYQTLNQLYRERMGFVARDDAGYFANWGKGHENEARFALEDDLGSAFLLPLCVEHGEHPLLRASLDGWDGARPCEIKCPTSAVFADVTALGTESEAYRRYYPQVQFQMLVTGAQEGVLFFWRPDDQHKFVVPRDSDYCDLLLARALDFSRRLLSSDEPPIDPAKDVYRPTGDSVAEWNRLTAEYRSTHAAAEATAKAHKKRLEELKAQLVALKGSYARASHNGIDITSSVSMRLDTERLRAELPKDFLKQYEKASESVRITVSDEPAAGAVAAA